MQGLVSKKEKHMKTVTTSEAQGVMVNRLSANTFSMVHMTILGDI